MACRGLEVSERLFDWPGHGFFFKPDTSRYKLKEFFRMVKKLSLSTQKLMI